MKFVPTYSQNVSRRLTATAAAALMGTAMMLPLSAYAQSFEEALRLAYETNPTIDAARADLRSVDELVPQARGGYLPTIRGSAYAGYSDTDNDPGGSETTTPTGASITANQYIFRGGRTFAEIDQAENTVLAQRGSLTDTTQQILLSAAAAYFDVVRDQAVVALNENNQDVLDRQLQASRDRFDVGEVTRTDVSQSESRLARAQSDLIEAQGNLEISRSNFARIVGQMPEVLTQPELDIVLPETLEEAITMALDSNPAVVSSRYSEVASKSAIDAEFADLLPEIILNASASRNDEPSNFTDRTDELQARVTISIPLYQAGVASSQVREAKQRAARSRRLVDEAIRFATDTTVAAWEALESARAQIESRQAQVDSSNIALEGVRQEALVGSRTTLDVLDAEQELLDAQVNLATAVRNESTATFQLLSAIGSLSPQFLGLNADVYDPTENYDRVRDKLWGISVE